MSASLTGFISHMSGPWRASFNDAKILMTELKDYHELRNFFTEFNDSYGGDCILILDRGYRDALSYLDDLGLKYEMPTLQQVEPRIFDNLSEISVRLSQLSQISRPEEISDSEIASQRSNKSNLDSGVVTQQPTSSQRSQPARPRRKKKNTRRPWDVYLASKPLTPAGKANQSRLVSSKRHSIEVCIIFVFILGIFDRSWS